MNNIIPSTIVDDAVGKTSQLSLNFLHAKSLPQHVPFTFTPSPIRPNTVAQLESVSPLLGRLTHELSLRGELLQTVHDPLALLRAAYTADMVRSILCVINASVYDICPH